MSQVPYPSIENVQSAIPSPTSGIPVPPSVEPQATKPDPGSSISRAPVRYSFPTADPELPKNEAELEKAMAEDTSSAIGENASITQDQQQDDQPRSSRPGQKGFAARHLAKYGWEKGQGLGATGTGITTALQAQVEKRKKRSDAEGGGFATPAGVGKIVGGKKSAAALAEENGKFGAMSEVIVLVGMLDGRDVDAEIRDGIMQDIGGECGEKYGNVVRVFVHRNSLAERTPVFVKFTSQLSALRAVNALEGRLFGGNAISAKYYDAEKFEQGEYE